MPGHARRGGPGGLTYADFGHVATRPEVHSDGEIWLQTLWQLRRELGSPVTEALVTRAMELSPQAPTFVDMRNAILVADAAIFGSAHHEAIWQVFASRGMGFFASASDTFDTHPVADFSSPVDCPGPDCGSLSGRVTDPTGGGTPVAGALVRVAGAESGVPVDLSVMTGPDGRFHIPDVPDGLYRDVEVSLDGYATRTVHARPRGRLGHDAGRSSGAIGPPSPAVRSIVRFTGPDHTGWPANAARRAAVDDSLDHQLAHLGRPAAIPHDPAAASRSTSRAFAVDPSAICAGRSRMPQAFDVVDAQRRRSLGARVPDRSWAPGPSTHAGPPAGGGARGHTVRLVLRSAVRSRTQVEFTELVVRTCADPPRPGGSGRLPPGGLPGLSSRSGPNTAFGM